MRPITALPSVLIFSLLMVAVVPDHSFAQRKKGYVSSFPCPFSCKSQRIPKKHCRDWKEGNTCFVEDLRRPPKNTSTTTPKHPTIPLNPTTPGVSPGGPGSLLEQCRQMRRIESPRIDIERVKKSGNVFKDKYRVEGSIEGICLSEAGLFHRGQKDENIHVTTTPYFKRFDFEVIARSDKSPEIRAYNVQGGRDTVDIDPREYSSDGYGDSRDNDDDDDDDDDDDSRRSGTAVKQNKGGGINLLDELFGK